MSDETHPLADLSRKGEIVTARLTRRFDHPSDLLWRMLTDSAQLPKWLAPGTIDLKAGGAARLDFADSGTVIDSTVTGFEPGRLIEYSWSRPGEPERPVRWRIEPQEGGARLDLELRVPANEDAGRACAGWEAHLEMLEAALEGVPIKFPFESFKAAREAYRGKVATLS
jgi:uncharacterized protein YndB with AHSA1/START domain